MYLYVELFFSRNHPEIPTSPCTLPLRAWYAVWCRWPGPLRAQARRRPRSCCLQCARSARSWGTFWPLLTCWSHRSRNTRNGKSCTTCLYREKFKKEEKGLKMAYFFFVSRSQNRYSNMIRSDFLPPVIFIFFSKELFLDFFKSISMSVWVCSLSVRSL